MLVGRLYEKLIGKVGEKKLIERVDEIQSLGEQMLPRNGKPEADKKVWEDWEAERDSKLQVRVGHSQLKDEERQVLALYYYGFARCSDYCENWPTLV